jgi:hypothetical protein
MTLHFLSTRSEAARRIALLISVAVLVGVPLPGISAATDDLGRLRQAVVSGNSGDLRTLLKFPGVRTLVAQKDNNDLLYLAIEKTCGNRYNGSDASAEELQRSAACDERQAQVIKVLLENGARASINATHPRPPALLHAVRLRTPKCVEALLAAGPDPNIMDNGYRPLPLAAKNGATAPEIVKLLLDAGADPNRDDKENGPPLVAILNYGQWSRDLNDARREKIPGRYELLRTNSKNTVEMLLQAGADPSVGLQVTLLHEKPAAADDELIPLFVAAGGLKRPRYTRDQALEDLLRAKVDRGWPDSKYIRIKTLIENGKL